MEIRDGGVWKPVNQIQIRDAGQWKNVISGHIYSSAHGGWKPFHQSMAEPFTISGTFASNSDGWSTYNSTSRTTTSAAVRTSPGGMRTAASATGDESTWLCLRRTFTPAEVRGLRVAVKYWKKRSSSSGSYYTYGRMSGLPEAEVIGSSAITTSWSSVSYGFDVPLDWSSNLVVDIETYRGGTARVYIDDWEITGVPIP